MVSWLAIGCLLLRAQLGCWSWEDRARGGHRILALCAAWKQLAQEPKAGSSFSALPVPSTGLV